jgi:hypothetical protein
MSQLWIKLERLSGVVLVSPDNQPESAKHHRGQDLSYRLNFFPRNAPLFDPLCE